MLSSRELFKVIVLLQHLNDASNFQLEHPTKSPKLEQYQLIGIAISRVAVIF